MPHLPLEPADKAPAGQTTPVLWRTQNDARDTRPYS